MILADFHTHSTCSPDAYNTIYEMALAAAKKGISIMCATDHVDLDDCRTGIPMPDFFANWEEIQHQYLEAKDRLSGKIDLRLGVEFGEANHGTAEMIDSVISKNLDFIIGSLHNLRGRPDFFSMEYHSAYECQLLVESYIEELIELARLGCFDVMGHVGYTRRYMKRAGFDFSLERQMDRLGELFRILCDAGKGIELNVSGLRDGTDLTFPDFDVLKLYRESGGEIITVGSDAHTINDAGAGIREGIELLKKAGFKYYTVFMDRKPEFISLR